MNDLEDFKKMLKARKFEFEESTNRPPDGLTTISPTGKNSEMGYVGFVTVIYFSKEGELIGFGGFE